MKKLKGTFPVLVTPMNEKQEIDIVALKRNLDWYMELEMPGVCILGSTGEFSSLNKDERLSIAQEALKHVDGRMKCIIGTAAETTKDTIEYTKHAYENGADAVMIINPYYCLPSEEELLAHYKAISDAVDIPIMIYNNPPHSGVDIKPDVIGKLYQIKNVEYIKDASGDLRRISDFRRETNDGITIFCGGEDLTFENFLLGAKGWICVSGNIVPNETKLIYDYIQQDRIEEAKEIFDDLYPLLHMLENSNKPLARVKAAMKLIGKDSGTTRLPRLSLTDLELEEVKNVLRKIGKLN
ncbi:MAG: 4-hydroxy-tetrahydrodipicolinate synthase [Bacillota bacterium]|nr:4-hydroxy-tetrahydrodipicolinate synthase [Bacillota bacterium]